MVKPYTLRQAQDLVKDAVHRAKPRHERWRKLELLYRTGKAQGWELTTEDVPGQVWDAVPDITLDHVNLALPLINLQMASVVQTEPAWTVEPFEGGEPAELGARVGEQLLRYFWRRANATPDMRDITQDRLVIGNGFVKTGWITEQAEYDRDPLDIEDDVAERLDMARRLATLADEPMDEPETIAEGVPLTESVTLRDEPFVEYVSPYDIFVPVNARRMWETRWVAQRLVLPYDEVRHNPAFKNRDELKADGTLLHSSRQEEEMDWPQSAYPDHGEDDPFETVTIFEFYDMRARRLLVFQTDAEKPLYDDVIPYSHGKPPFIHLGGYRQNGDQFWCFGEMENIAPIQQQFNGLLFEQMDNARRSGNKYLVARGALTDDLRNAIDSDEPDVVAPVEVPNGTPLTDVIIPVERKGLPEDVYAARSDLERWMQQTLGANDFMAGGTGADRMSATAAAITDGIATTRAQLIVSQVEEAHAGVGQVMFLLMQEFLEQERAVRIIGEKGTAWAPINAADIEGEYRVQVDGGSTRSINPATRRQNAIELVQVVIPAMEASGFDSSSAWRKALRDLGYDPDQMLQRVGPDPAQMPNDAQAATALEAGPAGPGAPGGPGAPPPDGGAQQPAIDELMGMGGPPVPAATNGGVAL